MIRKFLSLLLVPLLLLSLLSGCGTQELTDTSDVPLSAQVSTAETETALAETTAEETENTFDTLGLTWQSSAGLHPYTCTSVTNQTILSLLYEGLFLVTDSFEAEPLLCESFAVSEDGTAWQFTLREDVTFTDGTALTAADVTASLLAAKASPLYAVRFRDVTSVTADGSQSVVIRLSSSYENLPLLLDVPIVKASTLSSEVPVGTGPYAFSGAGTASTLVRNHSWWQQTTPVVDAETLNLVVAEDSAAVRDAFEFGGADLVYTDPLSSSASQYHCDYELWSCPTTVMQYIGFNQNSDYCYSAALRSGITYIVDRDTLIAQIYDGFGLSATLPCSPLSPIYDSALASSYAYNPGAFQACVQSSGITPSSSNPIQLIVNSSSPKRVDAAEYIAAAMNELSVYTEVVALDAEAFQAALQSGEYDMYLGEIRLPTDFDLSAFFASDGSASFGGNADGSALQLCASALENSGNYYDLHRTVMNRGLICPILFKVNALYATRGVVASHSPSVSNLFLSSTGRTLDEAKSGDAFAATTETQPETDKETDSETTTAAGSGGPTTEETGAVGGGETTAAETAPDGGNTGITPIG
ncbi:MAG: ABC transporter substrate-binding protein [Oscillospiraceae bacterium]|nr:ABC transporter substrate-binding protein [Oscillospiraceae bacterium]